MEGISPHALQFAGSLVAVLVLAWLVRTMGLGSPPRLDSDADVAAAANEVCDGFSTATIARDVGGIGAIIRDSNGRIMVLKQHGGHFAGRILDASALAAIDGTKLVVDTGEKRFGSVSLQITEPEIWLIAIDGLSDWQDA